MPESDTANLKSYLGAVLQPVGSLFAWMRENKMVLGVLVSAVLSYVLVRWAFINHPNISAAAVVSVAAYLIVFAKQRRAKRKQGKE